MWKRKMASTLTHKDTYNECSALLVVALVEEKVVVLILVVVIVDKVVFGGDVKVKGLDVVATLGLIDFEHVPTLPAPSTATSSIS